MQNQRFKQQQQQALMQQAILQQQSLYHPGLLAAPQWALGHRIFTPCSTMSQILTRVKRHQTTQAFTGSASEFRSLSQAADPLARASSELHAAAMLRLSSVITILPLSVAVLLLFALCIDASVHEYAGEKFVGKGNAFVVHGGSEGIHSSVPGLNESSPGDSFIR
ncbi:hypothetical protein CASFOL_001378 [Castilleja foliolosa]|uniref:Uncharacterized protein n=1 Tax=Castilleja foliolosa TaxID=1961234 RepID=A0ABD3EMD3_9LAMI